MCMMWEILTDLRTHRLYVCMTDLLRAGGGAGAGGGGGGARGG